GNGNMGGAGTVAWMFEKKGFIVISKTATTEDQLMEIVLGAGAEDMTSTDQVFEITTAPHDLWAVREAVEKAKIKIESANLTMIPKNLVGVSADTGRKVIHLIEALEEHDDVQNVYSNADIPEEVIKEMSA
ncbi:MAG: YebC/PmpR family DNA-binding transcriptional regulator, partial [Candidatus Omnitrophota bacterium]